MTATTTTSPVLLDGLAPAAVERIISTNMFDLLELPRPGRSAGR